ncbi:hypothetical protein RND81_10G088300 [Saponaria officinalis]|uniref:AFG1-like ATPase n=1 Tax=Saponaria officinalis TaxID=3572 RepID=A0AAW1HZV9_SAPOF
MLKKITQLSYNFSNVIVRCNPNFRMNLIRSYSNHPGPLVQYKNLVKEGKLQHDTHQEKVASELENLLARLNQYEKDMKEYHEKLASWEKKREDEHRRILMQEAEHIQQNDTWRAIRKKPKKLVDSWVKMSQQVEAGVGKWVSYLNREKKIDSLVGPRPIAPVAPKGLYLYGNVGSGKTMLMDMFYSATGGVVKHRKRFHFHEAMLEINEHMHKLWKNQVEEKSLQTSLSGWIMNLPFDNKVKEWLAAEEQYKQQVQVKNILPAVADKFLVGQHNGDRGSSILCFDEIQTVDVFAIVALSGIISRLLTTGTVFVATSNRAPTELNQDGMQKEIFLQLVEKLEDHCQIVPIGNEIDYRRLIAQRSVNQAHYFHPLDNKAAQEFEKMWSDITKQCGGIITTKTLPVMFGRTIEIPESCNGVARFSFDYLCGRAVGAADYIAIANHFHTVFISNIPIMSMRVRDKARRFITLIDELYNRHCRLFCSASCSIDDLFQGTEEGTLFDLESFQFETEMEGSKLRRDVLAEGSVTTTESSKGIISLLSAEEEMFAFRRAVSRLIEMQTPVYLDGVRHLHPSFLRERIDLKNDQSGKLQFEVSA